MKHLKTYGNKIEEGFSVKWGKKKLFDVGKVESYKVIRVSRTYFDHSMKVDSAWTGDFIVLVHGHYEKSWSVWKFDILDEIASDKKSDRKSMSVREGDKSVKFLYDSDNLEDAQSHFNKLKEEEPYKTWVINATAKNTRYNEIFKII